MSDVITNPAFKALYYQLEGVNTQLKSLLDLLDPDVFDLNILNLDKAAAFTDTDVPCQGFNLIQISTDGNLGDVSYKVVQLDGRDSHVMEAAESPHILGPITAVLVTSDVAEPGKTVRVARYRVSPLMVSAIKHGTPQSVSIVAGAREFFAEKVDYAGTSNFFETDQALGTTPTLSMTGTPESATKIKINTIKHQLTPTNAVTYQLYLLEDTQAVDERSEADIIFDSGAAMAKGTIYIETGGASDKVPVHAKLAEVAKIYYLVDLSAASGDTTGYIKVYGEVLT